MRAWISGSDPSVQALQFAQRPVPAPQNGELLVQVTHSAVNFSDLLMIRDKYQVRPERPFIPGQEVAGIVKASGPMANTPPGSRVASKVQWGGFAEFAIVREAMAMAVPGGVRLSAAAALPVSYVTAVVALDHCASVTSSDTVLVHAAAGALGLAAVEVALARGATVIAAAGSAGRLAAARERGAHFGIDCSDASWPEKVKSATGGRGVSIAVDPVGGTVGETTLRCLARDGVLLIVGFASGRMPQLAANRLLLKRASAKGVYWSHEQDAGMVAKASSALMRMLEEGSINPAVDGGHSLGQLPRALEKLEGRRAVGKIVLNVD